MKIFKNYKSLIAGLSLIFLFVFNFGLVFRMTSFPLTENIYNVLFFIVPLLVASSTIVRDKEKIPRWIRIASLIALSAFALFALNNSIIFLTYLSGGGMLGENLALYKPLLLFLVAILVGCAYFLSRKRHLLQNLAVGFTVLWFVTLLVLGVLLVLNYQTFRVNIYGTVDPKALIFPFMPIVYLSFSKSDEANRKKIGRRILVISLVITFCTFLAYFIVKALRVAVLHDAFYSFFQENVIYSLKLNYNSILSAWVILLIVMTQILVVLISASLLIYSPDFENAKKLDYRRPVVFGGLSLVFSASILYLFNTSVDYYSFNSNLLSAYFITQMIEVFLIMGLVFFIGLKKYYHQGKKFLIYVLATFPLIYIFHINYSFYGKSLITSEAYPILGIVVVTFSALVFLYYVLESIALWYAYGRRHRASDLKDIELKKSYYMYVLIPCMNEELVIQNTVRSLLNNEYPNLRVTVIDDASKDKTIEQVEAIHDERLTVFRRIKPEAQQGKGEALNWAFYQLSDEIAKKGIPAEDVLITIIDADTQVEKDYFEKVNLVFNADPELTGLQSKVRVISKTRDTAQDLEFSEIMNAFQSLRVMTGTVAFGGNGQFCKLSTMQGLNEKPWTNSLVEDFDLSTRLFLSDLKVKHTQYDDIFILQTGIMNDNKALVRQRVRWSQGNMQSAKYIWPILNSNHLEVKQKVELLSTLIKPWIMGLEYLIVFFTYPFIVDMFISNGVTSTFLSFIIIFMLMGIYIILTNLVWAFLYNRQKEEGIKIHNIIIDTYHLCRFMVVLSQIYPQSAIRFFRADNSWKKTERQ